MKPHLPPLNAELRRLLDLERDRPPLSDAIKASVATNLDALLSGAALLRSTPATNGLEAHARERAGRREPGASADNAAALSSSGIRATWMQLAPAVGTAFLVGGALGFWLGPLVQGHEPRSLSHVSERVRSIEPVRPSDAPRSPSPSTPARDVAGGADAVSIASAVPNGAEKRAGGNRVAPEPRREAPADTRLAEERALIDTARSALARGNAASALEILARHQKDFRAGQLGEESAALRVQALAAAGRLGEAGEHAARFRLRYPRSVLLPKVNAAVGAHPIRPQSTATRAGTNRVQE